MNKMCNLFHQLLKELFWHIKWGILTAPMRMMKYILGPQETYEEVVSTIHQIRGIKSKKKTWHHRIWYL